MLEIRLRQKDNVIILDLSGRIDVDAANLVETTGQVLRDGYLDVLCNFEEVDFIDYVGVSLVAVAYKEVMNFSGRMKFTNIPAHLKSIFAISGLDRAIEMHASEDTAVSAFGQDKAIEDIKKMQLRRRFKRLDIGLKVELKDKYDTKAACSKVDVLNLSAVGAFIFGCAGFKLGDEVLMKLTLPPKLEQIELSAKVVWLSDKQIQPHAHPGMGIEFQNIPGPIQQKLIEFIDRNLSFMSSE